MWIHQLWAVRPCIYHIFRHLAKWFIFCRTGHAGTNSYSSKWRLSCSPSNHISLLQSHWLLSFRMIIMLWAHIPIFFTHVCLVFVIQAILNCTPLKYRCPLKTCNIIKVSLYLIHLQQIHPNLNLDLTNLNNSIPDNDNIGWRRATFPPNLHPNLNIGCTKYCTHEPCYST